jgi:hypothetical protein
MSKMDIEKVAAYGDDLTDNTAITQIDDGYKEKKPKKKKKRDSQDRVVAAQICLATIVLIMFAAVKLAAPDLFGTLCEQYTEFISETPVWDLEGIAEVFTPSENTTLPGTEN